MKIQAIVFLLICMILFGCKNDSNRRNPSELDKFDYNKIQTELGVLPKLMSLPKQPLSVKWNISENSKHGTGFLVALFKFLESDYKYILDNSHPFENKVNDRINIEYYDKWLPSDAKISIRTKTNGEVYELIGIFGFKPNLFTKTQLSPYIHGNIIPLNNGYIWVELYTM